MQFIFNQQEVTLGAKVGFMYGDFPLVAFITDPAFEVDGKVQQALTVFPPNAQPFTVVTTYDVTKTPGTWHWL